MKRILSIVLCVTIGILFLCGCGAKKVNVTFKDGSNSNMSAKELIELEQTNERKFDTISSLSGSGIITEVVTTYFFKTSNMKSIELYVDDDIYLQIYIHEYNEEFDNFDEYVKQFYKGDKITFKNDRYNVFVDSQTGRLSVTVDCKNVSIG